MAPDTRDFQRHLSTLLKNARNSNRTSIDIVSGQLHELVGGYPSKDHRMPTCCDVMRNTMQNSDEILYSPDKGKGATLCIRYHL